MVMLSVLNNPVLTLQLGILGKLLWLMGRIVKGCVREVSLAQVSCILMYVYVAPPHQWVRGRWPWGYGSALSIITHYFATQPTTTESLPLATTPVVSGWAVLDPYHHILPPLYHHHNNCTPLPPQSSRMALHLPSRQEKRRQCAYCYLCVEHMYVFSLPFFLPLCFHVSLASAVSEPRQFFVACEDCAERLALSLPWCLDNRVSSSSALSEARRIFLHSGCCNFMRVLSLNWNYGMCSARQESLDRRAHVRAVARILHSDVIGQCLMNTNDFC